VQRNSQVEYVPSASPNLRPEASSLSPSPQGSSPNLSPKNLDSRTDSSHSISGLCCH